MIQSESTVLIAKPVSEVFTFIDDFSQAPSWLESCIELTQASPGSRAVGSSLHYKHRQGGHAGEMDGTVTAYEKDAQLEMKFADPMFEVVIAFRCAPDTTGCMVTHSIAITPKGLMSKLMTPMIKAGNVKQVNSNVSRLKDLLEKRP